MGGKTTSTTATKLNSIAVQSSALGLPLSVGWGRCRITRPNLIWYNAFKAIPQTTKTSAGKGLGGGSSNTTYTYTASIILALGEGPIKGVRTVYKDTSVFTNGATTALAQAGLSLALGDPDQAVWGYLTSQYPSQAMNYSGIAYAYAQDYALGDSASLPNHSFEVDCDIQFSDTVPDADPRDVLVDFLTSSQHGVPGWPGGMIGNLDDWSDSCLANNLLISPVLESQQQASDIIGEWMTATNSTPYWSEGVLKVKSYGDTAATGNGVTWTPDLTPIYDLTEDDFGDPNASQGVDSSGGDSDTAAANSPAGGVTLNIVDQSDAYNVVQIEFLDRANQYNTAISTAQDLANIVEYGQRKQDPVSVHSICDAGIAQQATQLLLQRTLYIREQYAFQLPWNFALLELMDLVTLTTETDELQLDHVLVRIIQIDEDENGDLTFTCEGVPVGAASAAIYSSHSGSGFQPNTEVAPGSVTSPVLINAPTSLTNGDPEIWCAAASSSTTWGGCEVWVSVDDVAYSRVGVISGPARYGVLSAALASHSDPDTTNTLSVDLSASLGELGGATSAEADAGASMCLVGDELVTYEDATLTGTNTYDLTTLHRGFLGTVPAAHAIGARFVRLDEAVFKFSYAQLNVGNTIYVKLPSFNIYGKALEDISTLSPFTVMLTPATAKPDEVTGLALAHAWSGSILSVVCNASARADTYKFRFYKSDETTLLREIVSTVPSVDYTSSLAAQDGVERDYAIEVMASNAAGDAAPSTWLTVSNAAPAAVTSAAIAGGTTTATATCDASGDTDVAGYILFYSDTSGFDPSTTGGVAGSGIPSINVFGLAAGTYYGRIAAYDGWTDDPTQLNLSSEMSFTISAGGGSTPSGGGPGGGGYGGFCPAETALVLLANEARDGPGEFVDAGMIVAGRDWVWTRPDLGDGWLGPWGAYPVTCAKAFDAELFGADGFPPATASHPVHLGRWVRMRAIGTSIGPGRAVLLSIECASTFVTRKDDGSWLVNHNKLSKNPDV